MNTNHTIFNSMIAQGFTLINASDDHGAYADCSHVSVQYPASDSDFLAISATNLQLNSSGNYVSETAWQPVSGAHCVNNGGGGGGGCSVKFPLPSYQSSLTGFCSSTKAVPDLSLNGDFANSPQNLYFNGGWQGNGGTSIAAPEFAGFMASENSYLLGAGNVCGSGSSACAPIGQAGAQIYAAANSHGSQGRTSFYDITSGCTSNDIGSGYCGITGYDRATGLGTPNMLQLAYTLLYWETPEASPPTVTITAPPTSTGWVDGGNVSWSIVDNGTPTAVGVAGYTAQWDADPGNVVTAATPGSGSTYYSGPAVIAASGSVAAGSGGEGCHTLYVRAWDKIGESSLSTQQVCFDDVAPHITKRVNIKLTNNTQIGSDGSVPVTLAWQGLDDRSGISSYLMYASEDGGTYVPIGSPSTNSLTTTMASGHNYVFAVAAYDLAGNFSGYSYSRTFHAAIFEEKRSQWSFAGTWTSSSQSDASGGSLKFTTTAGAAATFTYTGFSVGFVSRVDTNLGNATVQYDALAPVNVSLHGASAIPRQIKYVNNDVRGNHTVVVANVGTPAHPQIDVDAMVVLS